MHSYQIDLYKHFELLRTYCEAENFKGWDPYDGLNSFFFQATPLKKWPLARLIWIQTFKRNPVNLRKLFRVRKEHNAKGIALFLTGYCNLFVALNTNKKLKLNKEACLHKINELASLLLEMKNPNFEASCWGYNFDWQSRRLFLFPKNTPTVVATSFAVVALLKAYEITKNKTYKTVALSAGEFVLKDLNRTPKNVGFLFSYSPLKGNDTVYNASLLGSKILALCYHYTKNENYLEAAKASVMACIDKQQTNGSWFYGELPTQNWIDSFHTGYNLEAIATYQKFTGDISFEKHLRNGFNFYLNNFFLEDGTPKYYHDKTYPIDIHCPGQLPVTFSILGEFKENRALLDKVMQWTIENMQDKSGYFYYQLKKNFSSKIPYMRWSQAFMFYAFSYYFLENNND